MLYMNPIQFEELIRSKPESSYPDFVLDNVGLLSINKNKSSLVGSYSFAYPQFPSDIDVREVIDEGYTYDGVVNFFENAIKEKVREISSRPYYWVLEVKIGVDRIFDFSMNDPNSEYIAMELLNAGLLTQDEYLELEGIPEEADLLLQSLATLRWSPQEIYAGIKILRGNRQITLNEAIRLKSVINMEVIGISNNKIMDLSNFFALVYKDANGDLLSVNLPDVSVQDFPSFYVSEIKDSIYKLYYSKIQPDYGKMTKRYFSLGRFTEDKQLINKIYPFVNSIYALAGQKKSEAALLLKLVKHTKMQGVPIDVFTNQLSNMKLALANLVTLPERYLELILSYVNYVIENPYDYENVVENLDLVKQILFEYVNKNALKYLKKVGLAPPPKKYIN